MTEIAEQVLRFECAGETLWGLVSRPPAGASTRRLGVVIVVGGPQYRAGSHRQFVLQARALAAAGYPTLRFDYRGMGDSSGERRDFQAVDTDLSAAFSALMGAEPTLRGVVVWGLCDAASAAMMFASDDPRVVGLALANPWARSDASLAVATVKHYYSARLLQADFWRKLLGGQFDWRASLASLLSNLRAARGRNGAASAAASDARFQTRMARGLACFRGQVLLILSGNDLTAQEFLQYTAADPAWRGLLADPKISRVDLPEADHTFSRRRWLDEVGRRTLEWLDDLEPDLASLDAAPFTKR